MGRMTDDELDRRIRELHGQIKGMGRQLERDLSYLSSLVAAFRDAQDDHVLSIGGSCVKLGQRLTNLGESLKETAWETSGKELLRNRWKLQEPA